MRTPGPSRRRPLQGDERDVIVFSSTFGRNGEGVFRRHFGVLGQAGGERRLNVAATRARKKVVLMTSMPVEGYRRGRGSPASDTASRLLGRIRDGGQSGPRHRCLHCRTRPESALRKTPPWAPPSLLSTAIAALCVQAIWMTRAHSISSRGLAPSINAKLAFSRCSVAEPLQLAAVGERPRRRLRQCRRHSAGDATTRDADRFAKREAGR